MMRIHNPEISFVANLLYMVLMLLLKNWHCSIPGKTYSVTVSLILNILFDDQAAQIN